MADKKSFLLRIDPELWSSLQAWASDDLRSINGQIEFLLKDAVRQRGRRIAPPSAPKPLQEEQGEGGKSDTGTEGSV